MTVEEAKAAEACVSAVEVRYRPRPGGAGVRVELLPDDGEVGT